MAHSPSSRSPNPSQTHERKDQKSLVPLENNPEVMSALIHKLGISYDLSFHDVFSIEDRELLAFVPRPAIALLLVFPISEAYELYRQKDDQDNPVYNMKGAQEPVIWYKQTIRNACGLMAVLHAASNGKSRDFIEPNSPLEELIKHYVPLDPIKRAEFVYNFKALEDAHREAACQGQSNAPSAEDIIDLHYVCFIKDDEHNLWELDGQRNGPINHGRLTPDEDVLSERALDLGVKPFLKREEKVGNGELRFSLVALAPN